MCDVVCEFFFFFLDSSFFYDLAFSIILLKYLSHEFRADNFLSTIPHFFFPSFKTKCCLSFYRIFFGTTIFLITLFVVFVIFFV